MAVYNCPRCESRVDETMNVCPDCGYRLKVVCSKCGNSVNAGARFCNGCGSPVNGNSGDYGQNNYSSGGNRYNNSYRTGASYGAASANGMIIAICVLLVIIIVLGTVFIKMLSNGGNGENSDNSANQVVTTVAPRLATPIPEPTPIVQVVQVPDGTNPNGMGSPHQGQYIFNSDREYITEAYLSRLSRSEVRLILNEIYARHGYIFSNEEYREYFLHQPWYIPRYTSDTDAEAQFNAVERTNKSTIVRYEKAMGWR